MFMIFHNSLRQNVPTYIFAFHLASFEYTSTYLPTYLVGSRRQKQITSDSRSIAIIKFQFQIWKQIISDQITLTFWPKYLREILLSSKGSDNVINPKYDLMYLGKFSSTLRIA